MKSSRFFLPAAVICVLILAVLSCGCGDYIANHDIIVIAVNDDGTQAWTRTIDHGFDDVAGDIAAMPDGGLLIAAGNGSGRYGSTVPELIRLSPDGALISEHPCPSMRSELSSLVPAGEDRYVAAGFNGAVGIFDGSGSLVHVTETGLENVWSLAVAPDGSIAVAGQSWEQYPAGSVADYDVNGTLSVRPPLPDETAETPGCRETVIVAGERTIPVTECVAPMRSARQAMVVFLDRDGTITGRRGYGAYGLDSFWSIAAAGDGTGYYTSAFGPRDDAGTSSRFAVKVSGNGPVEWITYLGPAALSYPSQWTTGDGTARVVVPFEYSLEAGPVIIRPGVVSFDDEGTVTDSQEIAFASRFLIPVSDGGFFSAGFLLQNEDSVYHDSGVSGGDVVHALKLGADGSREWETEITGVRPDTVRRIIERPGGGYVILAERQNR